eukprot:TRINITY_DN959_c0_g2_i1.p1 TRINITY_DN959_c0_g2~~TRINITY_DN959_c0_g2_i1.p1  ORF type:complete len:519 (+),score=148.78 TRINITY_DN959_c0_g2_i1:68-1624(+)
MEEEVNDIFLVSLISLGFDPTISRTALMVTGNQSVEDAMNYILACQDEERQREQVNAEKQKEKEREQQRELERVMELQRRAEKKKKKEEERQKERENLKNEIQEGKLSDSLGHELLDIEYGEKEDHIEMEEIHVFSLRTTKVMDEKEALEKAIKEIQEVAILLEVSFNEAAALLRHFKWRKEVLTENYFDDPNKNKRAAGIFEQNTKKNKIGIQSCLICYDDIEPKDLLFIACGHTFCAPCWNKYLSLKIQEGEAIGITCMATKCGCIVPEEIVQRTVPDEIYQRYTLFIAKGFVDTHPNFKWCPSGKCGNCVFSEFINEKVACCTCGFKFCFLCNSEAHVPATCEMMKRWEQKSKDDSETKKWLVVNTKDCPKCNSPIEKNGGCQHMTCRKCTHEFCWICNGDWKGHSACNRFQGEGGKEEDEEKMTQNRASLQKYLHYYERYQFHENSKKFEVDLRQNAVQRMIDMRNQKMEGMKASIDFKFIFQATEQLIECRRTLKYTYVYAFYLEPGPEKNSF